MTQYTENYRLELYEGTDKADLTDQYNVSMGILDGAMKGVVDDTDASVAGIRADLATTNSNLNATNINLQALDRRESENHTAQQTAIDELKTTVGKNTPLLEEHVNYFAELGVTDEQSATDLHKQIDNTFQGMMSNTQMLQQLEGVVSPWKYVGELRFTSSGSTVATCPCYVYGGVMYVMTDGIGIPINVAVAASEKAFIGILPDNYIPVLNHSGTVPVRVTVQSPTQSFMAMGRVIRATNSTAMTFNVRTFETVTDGKVWVDCLAFPVRDITQPPKLPGTPWRGQTLPNLADKDKGDTRIFSPIKWNGVIDSTTKVFSINEVEPFYSSDSAISSLLDVIPVGFKVTGVDNNAIKIFTNDSLPNTLTELEGSVTFRVHGSMWENPQAITGRFVAYAHTLYAVFPSDSYLGSIGQHVPPYVLYDVSVELEATNISFA